MHQWTDEELVELWEERAAIREYDGQLPRKQAERAAYFDVRKIVGNKVPMPDVIRQAAEMKLKAS